MNMTAREAIAEFELKIKRAESLISIHVKQGGGYWDGDSITEIKLSRMAISALEAQIPKPNLPLPEMSTNDLCAAMSQAMQRTREVATELSRRTGLPVSSEIEVSPTAADIEAARKEQTE